jgi:hypothetical protein
VLRRKASANSERRTVDILPLRRAGDTDFLGYLKRGIPTPYFVLLRAGDGRGQAFRELDFSAHGSAMNTIRRPDALGLLRMAASVLIPAAYSFATKASLDLRMFAGLI